MRNNVELSDGHHLPAHLGRYEIVQKLGSGGMADVFLAHQPGPFSLGKFVVIKHLRVGATDDEQFVQMFADESRIALRLSHPNVVQTFEAVADGSDYYLVLEFLDGKGLDEILNYVTRARMPLALHVWILTQALAGLHYAHELTEFDGTPMHIVHRDVSPSNIFVTHDGSVKILDFGIAKSVGAITATREGIIKGKLSYAAPEQCLCKEVDRRTDIYSVGIMLWEALAGRRRATAETAASTYQARIYGTEAQIEEVAPHAPIELREICRRALDQQPHNRYQSAHEFQQALESYLQSHGWTNGAEQLRKFMHEHFAEDINGVRRRIDEHLGKSRSQAPRGIPSHTPAAGFSASLPQTDVSTGPTVRAGESKAAVWYRSRLMIGGSVAGVLAALALTFGLRGATTAPSDVAKIEASAAKATITNAPVAVPVSAAHSAKPTSRQIRVSLAVEPSSAEIQLDGRRVANPYLAAHDREPSIHHLLVSLAGYKTIDQDIRFDMDVDMSLVLSRRTQPSLRHADRGAAALQPRTRNAVGTQEEKANFPPPAETPNPGDKLRGRSSKKGGGVDEANPYNP